VCVQAHTHTHSLTRSLSLSFSNATSLFHQQARSAFSHRRIRVYVCVCVHERIFKYRTKNIKNTHKKKRLLVLRRCMYACMLAACLDACSIRSYVGPCSGDTRCEFQHVSSKIEPESRHHDARNAGKCIHSINSLAYSLLYTCYTMH